MNIIYLDKLINKLKNYKIKLTKKIDYDNSNSNYDSKLN